jgi:hypothetical protein
MSFNDRNPLSAVDDAIRRKFASEGRQAKLQYDPSKVVESDKWWYIPCGWIGSHGCIVNKSDLYVNWLGSAVSVEMSIWGHEHGLFCDLVDFAFAPDTDMKLAARVLVRFKHTNPNAAGVDPKEPVWYREPEVGPALSRHFPMFRRHFVWLGIPEIRNAYEKEGLRFTSALSDPLQ